MEFIGKTFNPTSESNVTLVDQNSELLRKVIDRAEHNTALVDRLMSSTEVNRRSIMKNAEEIDMRRQDILKNTGTMLANRVRIAELVERNG